MDRNSHTHFGILPNRPKTYQAWKYTQKMGLYYSFLQMLLDTCSSQWCAPAHRLTFSQQGPCGKNQICYFRGGKSHCGMQLAHPGLVNTRIFERKHQKWYKACWKSSGMLLLQRKKPLRDAASSPRASKFQIQQNPTQNVWNSVQIRSENA